MRSFWFLPVLLLLFAAVSVEASSRSQRDRDFEALQDFVNSKRTIPLEAKHSNLTISGDVRTVWASVIERNNSVKLRGGGGKASQASNGTVVTTQPRPVDNIPFSTSEFDVAFNLYLDYKCDRAWAVAWLEFENPMGIDNRAICSRDPNGMFGSGDCDCLCLRKAYMGYAIYADGCRRFDVELGRRPMYNAFDSRVQFQSRFDGILFKYKQRVGCSSDFYHNTGLFVIDERANHYGFIAEAGILNLCNVGFDLKYSFVDWKDMLGHCKNRCDVKSPAGASYRISQFTFSYEAFAECLRAPFKMYGAVLVNHSPKAVPERTHKADNVAYYIGASLGRVCGCGDWMIDVCYQHVEPLSVPDGDISGIGQRANLLRGTMTSTGQGYANYKGWRIEALYALTDNLSIDAILEFLTQETKKTGGTHSYSMFELQAIYAF